MKVYTHTSLQGNERLVGCIVRQEDLGEIARTYRAKLELERKDSATDLQTPSKPQMMEIGKPSKAVCEVLYNIP